MSGIGAVDAVCWLITLIGGGRRACRELMADDAVLWTLMKGPNRARAVTRSVPGVGIELRYNWNDETRATQVYRSTDDLAAAAKAKRKELLGAGWVDAPPHWSMGPVT